MTSTISSKTPVCARAAVLCFLAALFASAWGCGSAEYGGTADYPGGGAVGATAGGAQDIDFARTQIENGNVPEAETVTAEGLFSQHDFLVEQQGCDDLLCLRPAAGVGESLSTGEESYWVQLGMTSGFDKQEFERPPLDVVVAIDKSSAMSVDMTETNAAVQSLIDKLDDGDRIGIVTFDGDAKSFQSPTSVGELDRESLKDRVSDIEASGSMNLEGGLRKSYEMARSVQSGQDRMKRVMVLSCGYPDGSTEFQEIVENGADDGIGLSFFGVLLSFNHSLANRLSHTRGGNYYYLQDLEKVETVFDDEFKYMVTPLAYDLELDLEAGDGYEIAEMYGVPDDDSDSDSDQSGPEIDVQTVFASKRSGAIVARLEKTDEQTRDEPAGQVDFSYEPETAHGWTESHSATQTLTPPEESDESRFESEGVRKAAALSNTAEQMREALETWHDGDKVEARDMIEVLEDYLSDEAEALDDDGLREEADLVGTLRSNM